MRLLDRLKNGWTLAALIGALHAALALTAMRHLSPVWDEIVYPAAGYTLLKTGHLPTGFEHPPLAPVLYALPLLSFGATLPAIKPDPSRDPFVAGFEFAFRSPVSPHPLVTRPRSVALFCSLALGALLFVLLRRRFGEGGALIGLATYAFCPMILSRASLALLEMPLAFFLFATFAAYVRWIETDRLRDRITWTLLWTPP
jgi:hypothetical protein